MACHSMVRKWIISENPLPLPNLEALSGLQRTVLVR